MEYKIKDSGEREKYPTGAVRDTNKGKIRWDLIPVECLKRLAIHYTKGAEKYDEENWKKGIPDSRFEESATRHWNDYRLSRILTARQMEEDGIAKEDFLSATVFNILGLMWNEIQREKENVVKSDFGCSQKEPAYIRLRSKYMEKRLEGLDGTN